MKIKVKYMINVFVSALNTHKIYLHLIQILAVDTKWLYVISNTRTQMDVGSFYRNLIQIFGVDTKYLYVISNTRNQMVVGFIYKKLLFRNLFDLIMYYIKSVNIIFGITIHKVFTYE